MQKKNEYILLALCILLAIFARTYFWEEGKYGSDLFYHYTVVEQSLEKGHLEGRNDLAYCYDGVKSGHPIGYYAIPYSVAKITGIDTAFIIVPVLFGLISLLLGYFLIKRLFNRKVALITLFLASISLAHASKSYPFSYRGDNIVYPLLLGSLILLHLAFTAKKRRKTYAIAAGAVSAVTITFWNGYPLALIMFAACLSFYLLFKCLKKEKIKDDLKVATIGMVTQAIVFYALFSMLTLHGKGLTFGRDYYYLLLLGVAGLLIVLAFSEKKKSYVPLLVYLGIGCVSIPLLWDKIKNISAGFGSVQGEFGKITTALELYPTSFNQFYTVYFIILITSLCGIYFFVKKFNKEYAFFLGLLLPSIYLVSSAVRFMYIAAIPLIVLTGLCLDNKKIIRKKFDIFLFLTMVIVIAMLFWMSYVFSDFFDDSTPENVVASYEFLRENTPGDACVISLQQRGAMTEFFAKRHYYFNSLGFDKKRAEEVYTFWLTNAKPKFAVENPYILVAIGDTLYIPLINQITNISNLEIDKEVVRLYEGALFAQNAEKILVSMDENNKAHIAKIENGKPRNLRTVFIDGEIYHNAKGEDCLLGKENSYIFFNDKLCDSNIFKMVTEQEIGGLEKVYAERDVVIYKVL